jgi:hypothetical protein
MWYVGSRTAQGCHINDGYICSSKIIKENIQARSAEWVREIVFTGTVEEVLEFETMILQLSDAKHDLRSFNKHNNDGIFVQTGDKNPMRNPAVTKRNHELTRGDNHWTRKLGNKVHPQKGQKRPSITGANHPNKKAENAEKISKSHLGKTHLYQLGNKNPMRCPEIVKKISGLNHWTKKLENKVTCVHCNLQVSKSNHTRWHGVNCKFIKEKTSGKSI